MGILVSQQDRAVTTPRLISLAPIALLLFACAEDNVECRAAADCVVDGQICLDNRCQDYPRPDDNRSPPGGGLGVATDTGTTADIGGQTDTVDTDTDAVLDANVDAEEVTVASCADLSVSPSSLNLGNGDPGNDITDTLVIRNNGAEAIVVTSVFVPTPFNVREPALAAFPIQLVAGGSVTATVALVAGSGLQTSSIDVVTDVCTIDVSVRGTTE